MTWTQLHERMALMADLIDRAAESPNSALDFDGYMPDIDRLFGGYEGLLLSLQHRWLTALTAKLDQADHDGVPAEQARAELAAREPGLRGYCLMRPRAVRWGCGPCNAMSSGSSKPSAAWPAMRRRRRGRPLPEVLAGATRLTSRYAALVVLGKSSWPPQTRQSRSWSGSSPRTPGRLCLRPPQARSRSSGQPNCSATRPAITSITLCYNVTDRCGRRIAATTTRW
jgi:ATP adenylyltransferase